MGKKTRRLIKKFRVHISFELLSSGQPLTSVCNVYWNWVLQCRSSSVSLRHTWLWVM